MYVYRYRYISSVYMTINMFIIKTFSVGISSNCVSGENLIYVNIVTVWVEI